ncbi:IS21 family transposase [[Actinomadura] parvosata]|uniref:IS21 family transposase n=1 Tax=[Actinomadura] parvosata TaxID=1955412 RepID=UPI001647C627
MVDITEILVHWHAGRSKNEIAASLGLARNTVRKYVAAAEEAGIVPGGAAISSAEWAARVREWFPEVADGRLRQVTWPTIEQHRDYIVGQLKAGVTVTTIHQRLRDEEGLAVSIASMRRYVHANLPEEARASQVRVLRLHEAEPGAEAQIDYGQLGRWTDPRSGRRHTVQAFVMVLPASRHMFVYPVLKMDQQAWSSAHVAAFAFFGGCPARLVPDNLKTGVDRPDLYDPKINRAYAELASHYGVLVDPARSRKPRDKASVERPMPYIRDSFWRGRSFASLEEMREQAVRWCLEVAGTRACRPLADAAPLVVFNAVEAGQLQALPQAPFVLSRWSRAKVGPDIHARVDKVLYSIPWRYLGRQLDVRSTATMVQFFCGGELIKTHPRKLSGKQTDLGDYPPERVAFHQRTPAWCRRQAEQIGPACIEVVNVLLAEGALYRLRAAQGVLGLADKHDPQRLEAACARALAVGDPSYRTVKGILVAGTESDPAPAGRGDGGAEAFLHGPDALFAEVIPLHGASTPAAS